MNRYIWSQIRAEIRNFFHQRIVRLNRRIAEWLFQRRVNRILRHSSDDDPCNHYHWTHITSVKPGAKIDWDKGMCLKCGQVISISGTYRKYERLRAKDPAYQILSVAEIDGLLVYLEELRGHLVFDLEQRKAALKQADTILRKQTAQLVE